MSKSCIDFTTNSCEATSYMLNVAKQMNLKGNLFNRVVTARAIGMVGVSAGSLADATGHAALCVSKTLYAVITGAFELAGVACGLKGPVNPLGLKHWNKEEAAVHARKAVVHLVIAAASPVLGFLGVSAAQVPVLVSCGIKKPGESSFSGFSVKCALVPLVGLAAITATGAALKSVFEEGYLPGYGFLQEYPRVPQWLKPVANLFITEPPEYVYPFPWQTWLGFGGVRPRPGYEFHRL